MSTIQVDRIIPFQSSSVTIDGDIIQANAATTGSNTFVGNQIINGDLTASLQEGYAWVGGTGNVTNSVPTSSFGGGGTTDITALNAFTASQEVLNDTFATTGSNTFEGTQTINGGLNVSTDITADRLTLTGGAGGDLIITGSGRITSNLAIGISGEEQTSIGNISLALTTPSTGDELGLTSNGTDVGILGWNGPAIYGNNPDDEYPALIGFQNKGDWTDGTISILKPLSITGSVSVNNVVTQTFAAPADNTQKDLITLSGATINGVPYNYANQSIQNYPSFGTAYQDTFITEYYDSTSYLYGAEFLINGSRVGASLAASGSSSPAAFRIQDLYNGYTFGNFYADELQIGEFASGTRNRIGIGHTALPSLDLRANNIVVTGSILQSGGNSTFDADVNMNSNLNVGLNITADKLVLTGGSGLDLIVTGSGRITTALTVGPTDGDAASVSGLGISIINSATADELGFTNNGSEYGVSGWDGPSIYGNDPSDLYPAFIGFQNKSDWTDGRVSILTPLASKSSVLFTTGSNQQAGTAVLTAGTVTVSNSLVTSNSIIMLTKQTFADNHFVGISSKGSGTFTISSSNNSDTDTVGWFIINNS